MDTSKFSLHDLTENYFQITPHLIDSALQKLENDGYLLSYLHGKPLLTYPTINCDNHENYVNEKYEETEINDMNNLKTCNSVVSQTDTIGIEPLRLLLKPQIFQSITDTEKYRCFEDKIALAIKNKKIFTIYGSWQLIRQQLLDRGWIEKIEVNYYLSHLQNKLIDDLIKFAFNNNDCEKIILSKMLINDLPNFIFGVFRYPQKVKNFPYVNRIKQNLKKFNFTNKEGLIECIKKTYNNNIISDIRTPTFHRLNLNVHTDNLDFLRDYRTLSCLSLISFIYKENNMEKVFTRSGSIPITILKMAIDRVNAEIKYRDLNNSSLTRINRILNDDFNFPNKRWDNFAHSSNQIIRRRATFICKDFKLTQKRMKLNELECIIKEAEKYWPSLSSNGFNNLWILKPGNESRGKGIVIKQEYMDIINFARQSNFGSYIVQKYIEKPYLIYNTKFDIRQHILISITESKLNVWLYQDCYLRFCSHQYKTTNLHRAIHITNHSIQKKFKNGRRNPQLPSNNMWSLHRFKLYLTDIGNDINTWNDKILPEIIKIIVGIIKVSLDNIAYIPNTFELYGVDFILDENLMPILLEINGNPDMTASTIVTGKLCTDVLIDMVKVIVDLPVDSNLSTGKFELIYDTVCSVRK